MKKYIDAERLKEKIDEVRHDWLGDSTGLEVGEDGAELGAAESILDSLDDIIISLQQDETQVDKLLCSKIWWEEQGWIMIPPDATINGIDSLLKQVRKKLQQEQPEADLEKEIEEYFPESAFDTGWNYDDVTEVARDFWNKGYNARKEE